MGRSGSVGFEGEETVHVVLIHARRVASAPALCGEPPGSPWTTTRSYVTCEECRIEIERRLARTGSGSPSGETN